MLAAEIKEALGGRSQHCPWGTLELLNILSDTQTEET